jgi:hypothetical protein
MNNLSAPDRLSGGLIDHARLEGLFPSAGGLGLGKSRCRGADEFKQQKDENSLNFVAPPVPLHSASCIIHNLKTLKAYLLFVVVRAFIRCYSFLFSNFYYGSL